MKLRQFFAQVKAVSVDALEYPLYLAMPDTVDGDDIDVQLAQIGSVQAQQDGIGLQLIPASADEPDRDSDPLVTLSALIEALPDGLLEENDVRLAVELPLDRDKPGYIHLNLTDISGLHVGVESQEVWILLRPAGEFPTDALPA